MIKLTSEQKVWALRWAADYLEQHGDEGSALESLRHCADMTEKYCIPNAADSAEGIKYSADDWELMNRQLDDKDAAE